MKDAGEGQRVKDAPCSSGILHPSAFFWGLPMSDIVTFLSNHWQWLSVAVVAAGFIASGLFLPILIWIVVVAQATTRYTEGRGGFKLGVDLVGGTILVYEIDPDRKLAEN